jgi:hypothetical protein
MIELAQMQFFALQIKATLYMLEFWKLRSCEKFDSEYIDSVIQ